MHWHVLWCSALEKLVHVEILVYSGALAVPLFEWTALLQHINVCNAPGWTGLNGPKT